MFWGSIGKARRESPGLLQHDCDQGAGFILGWTLRVYHRGRQVGEHAVVPSGSPPQEDPRHAATRRRLRQRPHGRPRDKTPRFEQLDDPMARELSARVANAPHVVERPLATYEGGP